MSEKDYEKLAAVFNAEINGPLSDFPVERKYAAYGMAEALADVLAADNPRFDRSCFMAAVVAAPRT